MSRRRHSAARWLVVVGLIVAATNAATFLIARQDQAPAMPRDYSAAAGGPQAPLRKLMVINAHEHLYKPEHLAPYIAAAAETGVAKTLFVASNEFTFLGKGGRKDALYDWSNQVILDTYRQVPDGVIPFASVYPRDPDKLAKLKQYVAQGAQGLKLYSGHSTYYEDPLDDAAMAEVYAYCAQERLPICWHVNLTRYRAEFENVLRQYPDLIVIVPHFGVTFYRPTSKDFRELQALMDTYPNLYTDSSFGTRAFLVHGLEMVTAHTEIFRAFFVKYQDRIVFGTDMVVTGNKEKTAAWFAAVIRACRDVLEKDRYYFFMAAEAHPDSYKPAKNKYGELRGLALPDSILKKVYSENIQRILGKQRHGR